MFAPTGEDGLVLIIEHGDGGLGEENGTVIIAEPTNANE